MLRSTLLAIPLLAATLLWPAAPSPAQAPAAAAAPAATTQRGTIKSIDGASLALTTDGGKQIVVTLTPTTRLVQIAPGSTDLKSAQPIELTAIAPGDRVLVTGKAADAPATLTATRLILMKSSDIAERNAARQADWQRHGSGGIVSAVDPATGAITLTSGPRKVAVATTSATVFRRYAGDSVRFEDAQAGTAAQLQPGDQVRVRGARSEDGATIQAEEIVSGSFRNLAGTVASVDPSAQTLTLRDLSTKKNVIVKVTANSDFRKLPPEAAARLAGRARGQLPGAAPPDRATLATRPTAAGTPQPGQGRAPSDPADTVRDATGTTSRAPGAAPGMPPQGGSAAGPRPGANMDLAQMLPRFPTGALSDLKPGDALMIVASQAQPGAATVTAITMLSGVEPILAASPAGAAPGMTLSPWNVGGGAPGGGGEGGGQ